MSTEEQRAIINGPSADMVIDAFKYAFPDRRDTRMYVVLQVAINSKLSKPLHVQVTGLCYETSRGGMLLIDGNLLNGSGTIHALYNPKTRQGVATISY